MQNNKNNEEINESWIILNNSFLKPKHEWWLILNNAYEWWIMLMYMKIE